MSFCDRSVVSVGIFKQTPHGDTATDAVTLTMATPKNMDHFMATHVPPWHSYAILFTFDFPRPLQYMSKEKLVSCVLDGPREHTVNFFWHATNGSGIGLASTTEDKRD